MGRRAQGAARVVQRADDAGVGGRGVGGAARYWRVVPSLGTADVATIRSPGATASATMPAVPTRTSVVAPRLTSSSTTIARLGQPMPVACTLTRMPR